MASAEPFATGVDVPLTGRTRLMTSGRGGILMELIEPKPHAMIRTHDFGNEDGRSTCAGPFDARGAEGAVLVSRRSSSGRVVDVELDSCEAVVVLAEVAILVGCLHSFSRF